MEAPLDELLVNTDTEFRRTVRALRVYSQGQNFKTLISQFLQYADLAHIKLSDSRA